jgi:hypothetical protein
MADGQLVASKGDIIESVLIKGDLSKLTQEERSTYYMRVCESVGLNPLTKPLEYITLNGKLTLYALRSCTDQLRSLHHVSVVDMTEQEREGVYIVTVKVQDGQGRCDMAKGAVNIASLKGEALANAFMKAETKAKRRATLSICGLGVLDETEIETIPAAARAEVHQVVNPETGRMVNPNGAAQLKKSGAWDSFTDKVQAFVDARDPDGLNRWFRSEDVVERVGKWPVSWRDNADDEVQRALTEIEARESEHV